ncbi:MAG: hypothetical protein RLZZ184_1130 [Cyanobacteriota bacterium]
MILGFIINIKIRLFLLLCLNNIIELHHSLLIPTERFAIAPQHPQIAIPAERNAYAHNYPILGELLAEVLVPSRTIRERYRSPNLFINSYRTLIFMVNLVL